MMRIIVLLCIYLLTITANAQLLDKFKDKIGTKDGEDNLEKLSRPKGIMFFSSEESVNHEFVKESTKSKFHSNEFIYGFVDFGKPLNEVFKDYNPSVGYQIRLKVTSVNDPFLNGDSFTFIYQNYRIQNIPGDRTAAYFPIAPDQKYPWFFKC